MATEIATAYVSLVASTNKIAPDVRRSLGEVENDADATGSRIGSNLSRKIGAAFKVGGIAVAAVGALVGAGIGALATSGVKYNAAMENFQAGFSTLLGSTDKARSLLADLSSFAAATPFEMPSLAQASQTLLSFGEDSGSLMPDLKMLGDISLGNSDKLSGLALVYGQVQSQGKLMGQDLLQMINNGFNPLQIISEKTGESMSSLKDKMSKGQISFEDVRGAMQAATAEGGMFFNAMENGSKTLTGQWSTLTDGVHILSGTMVGSLSTSLTTAVLPALNGIVTGLTDLMNGVDGADGEIKTAAASLATSISTLLGPAIKDMVEAFSVAFTALAPSIGGIVTMLVQSLAALLPTVLTIAAAIILALVQGITANLPTLTAQAVPIILGLVSSLLAQLPALVEAAFEVLAALGRGLMVALPTLIPQVVGVVVQIVQTIMANLPMILSVALSLIGALAQGLLTALPTLINALPTIIAGIIGFLTNALPMIVEMGLRLFTALVDAMPQIITMIGAAIPQIINMVTGFFQGPGLNLMISAGVTLFVGIITALNKSMPQIIDALLKAAPAIFNAVIGMMPQMLDAGRQLIMGLAKGIANAIPDLLPAVREAMGKVLDSVKSFFGIHSPSTVFRDEVGAMLGAGMALGISDSTGDVTNATSGLTSAAVRSLQGFSSGLTATANLNVRSGAGEQSPVNLNVYPRAEQSEEAIGDAAARRLRFAMAGSPR